MLLEAEVDMFKICSWLDINENLSALQMTNELDKR